MIGTDMIVSNEGAEAFFAPLTLPILGQYGDYGRLEKPQCPANVKVIERLFGVNIGEFLDEPCKFNLVNPLKKQDEEWDKFWEEHCKKNNIKNDSEPKQSVNEKLKVTGCFVHKWAWDTAVKFMAEEATYGNSVYTHFPLLPKGLELLGFKKTAERANGRYKFIYTIEGCTSHLMASDGDFSHIEKANSDGSPKEENNSNEELVHSGKHFLELWKKRTGMNLATKEMVKKLKETHINNFIWDELVNLEKEVSKLRNGNEAQQALAELKLLLRERKTISRDAVLSEIYAPEVLEDNQEIKRLMAEYFDVRSFMYLNCKLFQPTSIGPQCGDRNAEKALLDASLKFNKQDRKKYG